MHNLKSFNNFFKLNEILDSNYTYAVKKVKDETYNITSDVSFRELRYEFITKNDILYKILFTIEGDGEARIDFHTIGIKDKNHNSIIDLINSNDSIKVFNTLKSIIFSHKEDINKLKLSSTRDRLIFYKKLLEHIKIKYDDMGTELICYLNGKNVISKPSGEKIKFRR